MTFLQDLVASLDVHLPWLLPTLETIELTFPTTARLLICVPLMAWLAVRTRAASASDRLPVLL